MDCRQESQKIENTCKFVFSKWYLVWHLILTNIESYLVCYIMEQVQYLGNITFYSIFAYLYLAPQRGQNLFIRNINSGVENISCEDIKLFYLLAKKLLTNVDNSQRYSKRVGMRDEE